jgi:rSAM/selenodomain-associated transferase 1
MSSESGRVGLIIFARFPRVGEVKTRLARTIGSEAATDFYRLCAEHVFHESGIINCDVDRFLFYSDGTDENQVREWVGSDFQLEAQTGDDLGERMKNAFRWIFERGAPKAIIIGTDVPDLSAGIIQAAIAALDSCDVVIGPCQDGGYYLLGINEPHTELFTGIPWSTDAVLEKTLDKAGALHLVVKQLPVLADIDTEADLRCWLEADSTDKGNPIRAFIRDLDRRTARGRFEVAGDQP